MDAAIVYVWIRLTSAGEMCGICSFRATGLVLGYAEPSPPASRVGFPCEAFESQFSSVLVVGVDPGKSRGEPRETRIKGDLKA
jgi:hypothetical protein